MAIISPFLDNNAETIKVAVTRLQSTVSRIRKTGRALETSEHIIRQMIDEMESSWSGKAKELYAKEFEETQKLMQEVYGEIEEHANQLKEAMSVYEVTEENNMAVTENLSADNVF